MQPAEFLKTPERLYRIEKRKRKEWIVRIFDWRTPEKFTDKASEGQVLGAYASKIVAFAAVAIDVDQYTRKEKL